MAIADTGYAILPNLLTANEIEKLRIEMTKLENRQAELSHNNLLRSSALVASWAANQNLVGFAETMLGKNVTPFSAFFLNKTPAQNWEMPWHQNLRLPVKPISAETNLPVMVEYGVPHIIPDADYLNGILIARISLDHQSAQNGAIEVVSGSHCHGILSESAVAAGGEKGPVVCPDLAPGSIFFFKALLVHRSRESTQPVSRRVLQIEYSANPPPQGFSWYGL